MSSPDQRDFVLAGGKVYPVEAYHAALNEALLERLEATLPQGSSLRRAYKAVRGLMTPEAHKAVMRRAVALLAESGADVGLADAIREARCLPIAAFPATPD